MFTFRIFPRIYLALSFILGVVVVGGVGFVLIEALLVGGGLVHDGHHRVHGGLWGGA